MSCSFFSFSCQCCARSCLWPFLQGIYSVECQWPCVPLKLNRLRTFKQDKLKLSMLSLLTFSLLPSSEIHFFPLGLFWSLLAHPVSYSILLFHQLKKKKDALDCICVLSLFFFSVGTWLQILTPVTAKSLTEYQLARPSDANRKEMLFGSLARPGHPMKKFFWGKFWISYTAIIIFNPLDA